MLTNPVEGIRKEGAIGFFKGIGKGVTGLVLKPMSGLFDATSKTTEGIRN